MPEFGEAIFGRGRGFRGNAKWYGGRNTLATFVSKMCEVAGIPEKKTNHSLRATGASAMFNAEVPEKMIKSVTGHKSSKALAIYERP